MIKLLIQPSTNSSFRHRIQQQQLYLSVIHVSMLSPRGGTPGRCGAFDFSKEFLVKIPTMGPQNLVKSDQISPGVPSIYIENEYSEVVFLYKYKNKFLPPLKAGVFQGFTKAPKAAHLQFQDGWRSTCPFLKRSMSFSRH